LPKKVLFSKNVGKFTINVLKMKKKDVRKKWEIYQKNGKNKFHKR